jgi:hypothetical protein
MRIRGIRKYRKGLLALLLEGKMNAFYGGSGLPSEQ